MNSCKQNDLYCFKVTRINYTCACVCPDIVVLSLELVFPSILTLLLIIYFPWANSLY